MAKKHETALLALILSGAEKGNQYLFPVLKELIKHRDFIFSIAPEGDETPLHGFDQNSGFEEVKFKYQFNYNDAKYTLNGSLHAINYDEYEAKVEMILDVLKIGKQSYRPVRYSRSVYGCLDDLLEASEIANVNYIGMIDEFEDKTKRFIDYILKIEAEEIQRKQTWIKAYNLKDNEDFKLAFDIATKYERQKTAQEKLFKKLVTLLKASI
jgi:hypothetical protein